MNAQQKVAVITGASQGIGAGLVRGFLDREAALLLREVAAGAVNVSERTEGNFGSDERSLAGMHEGKPSP